MTFLGVGVPFRTVERRGRLVARGASLRANVAASKRVGTTLAVVAGRQLVQFVSSSCCRSSARNRLRCSCALMRRRRCAFALILRGLMTRPAPPGCGPAGCKANCDVGLAAAAGCCAGDLYGKNRAYEIVGVTRWPLLHGNFVILVEPVLNDLAAFPAHGLIGLRQEHAFAAKLHRLNQCLAVNANDRRARGGMFCVWRELARCEFPPLHWPQ